MNEQHRIAKFWDMPTDICWACRTECPLERAHIVPKQQGGGDDNFNIHLLCWVCHKESETLMGGSYVAWLTLKRIVFSTGGYYCDQNLGYLKQLNEIIQVGKRHCYYAGDENIPIESLTEVFRALFGTELAPSFNQMEVSQ